MRDMIYMIEVQFVFSPKEKSLVALTIVSQFGVKVQIMFLVVQYQDYWLRSSFKKEIPFPANEGSFVHLAAQIKCYLKHENAEFSCVAEWLRALQKCMHKCEFESWPKHLSF